VLRRATWCRRRGLGERRRCARWNGGRRVGLSVVRREDRRMDGCRQRPLGGAVGRVSGFGLAPRLVPGRGRAGSTDGTRRPVTYGRRHPGRVRHLTRAGGACPGSRIPARATRPQPTALAPMQSVGPTLARAELDPVPADVAVNGAASRPDHRPSPENRIGWRSGSCATWRRTRRPESSAARPAAISSRSGRRPRC
jgi:hypothetical protein